MKTKSTQEELDLKEFEKLAQNIIDIAQMLQRYCQLITKEELTTEEDDELHDHIDRVFDYLPEIARLAFRGDIAFSSALLNYHGDKPGPELVTHILWHIFSR